ncbi:recombinase family protein [Vibrio cholerae]|nr:recombinase family protein [Morganella morganii]EJL6896489.1 recombinase family protein [Vibrio cholerae]EJG2203462.1 recombinase family protein [Morganella morganii]EKF6143850.1 recombinase family protein [Vibrio cholerae]EKF9618523.1 recombinase family protein [Vibrio cholerae]ELE0369820.1 recombinase family protein [Vibrio cholerae]
MIIGYARVSTTEQDTALQLDNLRQAGCECHFQKTTAPVDWA